MALLGPDLVKNQKIDRPYMAQLIFNDANLLQHVNALIHPAVGRAFNRWHQEQDSPYVLREAAILFESGSYQDCKAIIVVSAPEDLRLKRVITRSGETEAQVKNRMSKQWPQEKKEALANFIIRNDHQSMLIPQVLEVHENLIHSAN